MAGEELQVIHLRNDFYRDGFRKVFFSLVMIILAIILLIATSIYLHLSKPPPVYFKTDNDWRTLLPVPEKLPYLTTFNLLQWVSNALQSMFKYDFINYNSQLQSNRSYFTEKGWRAFENVINTYASGNKIDDNRLFVNGVVNGVPNVRDEGELENRYGWWVRAPMKISYTQFDKTTSQLPIFDILIVRVSTLNNFYGVAIENIILVPSQTQKGQGRVA